MWKVTESVVEEESILTPFRGYDIFTSIVHNLHFNNEDHGVVDTKMCLLQRAH